MNKTRYSATEFGGNQPMNFRLSGTLTYEGSAVKLVVRVLKSGTVLYKTHAHIGLLNVTYVCSCLLIYSFKI